MILFVIGRNPTKTTLGVPGKIAQKLAGRNLHNNMKILEKSAPLARTTKINLQSIPMHRLLRAPETTPSWILRTRSGGGGRGV